ncbi:class I SAM-dependent methyltransferase [Amycolatopsis jiangsuensis]|uniref:O-methyltransferase/aklanonic acid methyltransferase n=1 Tax=Amycolatopsis jiangsuensis TaxID=1181879 RepID=A0A840IN69_9PSEU|nr:methyltransferase domain-containing protein [Amycolatopsis jiangsuensis]MBB4682658.1 O-methyltransferase/aklanonic acid methyltransferase [Amycolatopsis jiangsuensis]
MVKSTERTIVFDELAGQYDNTGVEFFGPIAHQLLELLGPRPGERVLDVGCGRGAVLFPAAAAVGPEGYVLGIDIAAAMVTATAADVAARALGHVEVRVLDGAAPDLPAESFDLITASMSAAHFPDPFATAAHYARLLRPGGRIGVTGPVPPRALSEWDLGALRVDRIIAAADPAALAAAHPRVAALYGEYPFGRPGRMCDALRAAGFTEVAEQRHDVVLAAPTAQALIDWTWSNGLRVYWELVPADRREQVAAELTEELTARVGDGPVTAMYPVYHYLGQLPRTGGVK